MNLIWVDAFHPDYSTPEKPATSMDNEQNLTNPKKMDNLAPELMTTFPALGKAATNASIPAKFKELIAVAIAFTTQCPHCIDIHSGNARKAGATDTEMIEAARIAAALQVGTAVTHAKHALPN